MIRLQCGFKKICQLDSFFRKANLIKGEKLLNHVYSVEQIIENNEARLKGKCVSQVSDSVVYDVCLELAWSCHEKQELLVREGRCTCKAEIAAKCKHAAAVCLYVDQHEVKSCTSEPQKWGKPKGNPKRSLELFLFPHGMKNVAFESLARKHMPYAQNEVTKDSRKLLIASARRHRTRVLQCIMASKLKPQHQKICKESSASVLCRQDSLCFRSSHGCAVAQMDWQQLAVKLC
ncbi:uncharacterized protein LOC144123697 [Amblyomma americanum]